VAQKVSHPAAAATTRNSHAIASNEPREAAQWQSIRISKIYHK